MVADILTAAGIKHRRSRFPNPPTGTYAVWLEDIETDGPDGMPAAIYTHSVTIELYMTKPDDASEATLEAALDAAGMRWSKEDRYWIQSEQLYQTIYEYTYTDKRR